MKNHATPYGTAGMILLLAVFMLTSAANALEVAGIKMPDSLDAGKARLLLNGAGVGTRFFINVCLGGLYLKQKSHDPEKITRADDPMAIRLHVISTLITSEKMKTATQAGFRKSTGNNPGPIEDQINRFISVFKDKINKNDFFDLIYVPGNGTQAYKNDKYLSRPKGLPLNGHCSAYGSGKTRFKSGKK